MAEGAGAAAPAGRAGAGPRAHRTLQCLAVVPAEAGQHPVAGRRRRRTGCRRRDRRRAEAAGAAGRPG
ncbi:hypothetical protein G6F57_022512 [Rhizopus arrhizus]|nr:hypothetical protein G6F57_022512 [Rhizopus arrhizus]